eukprot:COSAG01_NODE_12270_length_1769_cov_4.764072_1_plen_85_part_00
MDPAGVPTVCFIRNMKYDVTPTHYYMYHTMSQKYETGPTIIKSSIKVGDLLVEPLYTIVGISQVRIAGGGRQQAGMCLAGASGL